MVPPLVTFKFTLSVTQPDVSLIHVPEDAAWVGGAKARSGPKTADMTSRMPRIRLFTAMVPEVVWEPAASGLAWAWGSVCLRDKRI
jgi:hypothetical protein